MNRIPGAAAGPPYSGVVERRRADGSKVYKAQHVRRRRGDKFACVHLGTYDNPLRAYFEVVNARANAAEAKAKALRAEADQVLSDLVRGKR